jgi:hypothetical protein
VRSIFIITKELLINNMNTYASEAHLGAMV